MKAVIQRVKKANVQIEDKVVGEIKQGILVLFGVEKNDSRSDADFLSQKIIHLRMFDDSQGKMNLAVKDVGGEILVVSQFTLLGDCQKGRRPSFDNAAEPKVAEDLYNYFVQKISEENLKVQTGRFRAMMEVSLVNDGPVTFIIDSNKEN